MTQPTDSPIRFALLGAGRMGAEHGRALVGLPEAQVVAVAHEHPRRPDRHGEWPDIEHG